MKSIFPGAIEGDLLKLVYLSNSFRMVEGAKPLQVGDICRPEARIVSVINSSKGKIVKVKDHCYRNNQPVIEGGIEALLPNRLGYSGCQSIIVKKMNVIFLRHTKSKMLVEDP